LWAKPALSFVTHQTGIIKKKPAPRIIPLPCLIRNWRRSWNPQNKFHESLMKKILYDRNQLNVENQVLPS
jgi:hypothetical protein